MNMKLMMTIRTPHASTAIKDVDPTRPRKGPQYPPSRSGLARGAAAEVLRGAAAEDLASARRPVVVAAAAVMPEPAQRSAGVDRLSIPQRPTRMRPPRIAAAKAEAVVVAAAAANAKRRRPPSMGEPICKRLTRVLTPF